MSVPDTLSWANFVKYSYKTLDILSVRDNSKLICPPDRKTGKERERERGRARERDVEKKTLPQSELSAGLIESGLGQGKPGSLGSRLPDAPPKSSADINKSCCHK